MSENMLMDALVKGFGLDKYTVDSFNEADAKACECVKSTHLDSDHASKLIADLCSCCDKPYKKEDLGWIVLSAMAKGYDLGLRSHETKTIKYYDEDEQVWKIGEVIINE